MNEYYVKMYMEIARVISKYSRAERLKVGSIIVKDDRIITIGINGTPEKWETNICEDVLPDGSLITKDEVIHAEMNALAKLAKSPESGDNTTMFITHAPCLQCAKGIYSAGISMIYYDQEYKSITGIDFLKKLNVNVIKFGELNG